MAPVPPGDLGGSIHRFGDAVSTFTIARSPWINFRNRLSKSARRKPVTAARSNFRSDRSNFARLISNESTGHNADCTEHIGHTGHSADCTERTGRNADCTEHTERSVDYTERSAGYSLGYIPDCMPSGC